ncbi:MAG: tRNA-dihydrouridine synthase family protein [Firmicutes bacterium]|nr:tRNA-dihydrouridine synthase family protein [Bacillota bacterium]
MKIHVESAPMAGFTNHAFRRVLMECGAKILYTEMISATALVYKSKKTYDMLGLDKAEGIINVVQLFGKVPEHFEQAIKSGYLDNFDEININMGCPAPKITRNSEGCALMKTPDLARQIIQACVRSTDKPVTVKFRLGYEQPNLTAVEFAKMCEQAGARRLIVHGRYASQGYSGVADWHAIARVVQAVNIPVIANGDVVDLSAAQKCLEITGANGLMIGRALFGSPWKINFDMPTMTENEIKNMISKHIEYQRKLHGEGSFSEIKKHMLFYCDNFKNSKELKLQMIHAKTFNDAIEILEL